jgi:hypothetical protein
LTAQLTRAPDADGEDVWSRRPDAGVKFALRSAGDGGYQARTPRRARDKPLKPLRRECRSVSAEPVCSCAFFCAVLHTRPRVQRAPGVPCALRFRGVKEIYWQTRAKGAARSRNCVCCLKIESELSSPGLTGRPSIPETSAMESRGCGLLDPPVKPGDDDHRWTRRCGPQRWPRGTTCIGPLRPPALPAVDRRPSAPAS